jgi:hypothetical protein
MASTVFQGAEISHGEAGKEEQVKNIFESQAL